MTKITITIFNFFKNLQEYWVSLIITLGVGGVTCYIGVLTVSTIQHLPGVK